MNASELRELAKREYDAAVAKAQLVYETRLDIAKRMERGARQPAAARKAQKVESPAGLETQAEQQELALDPAEEAGAVPRLEDGVRELLNNRVGETFKISALRDWLTGSYPGIRTDRQAMHRVLKKLQRDGAVRVVDAEVRGNEGFSFQVLKPSKV